MSRFNMAEILEREMTISHSDFFRILPKALGKLRYQQQNNVITVFLDDGVEGEIVISLSKERIRKIGSLSLPVTDVTFLQENISEKKKTEFFKHFDRAYHRGGG
ncbi:MAG: hypothetical protein DRQ58_01055 [Gammaproteobacteria bacterium]|nr:MAG: hypothetical protein DRQ58_01055 [Gammaproteobacteria bacterium]